MHTNTCAPAKFKRLNKNKPFINCEGDNQKIIFVKMKEENKMAGRAHYVVKAVLFLCILVLQQTHIFAQSADTTSGIIKKRFVPMVTIVGVGYTGAMIGLNELWYKNEPRTSFHFFNDNNQWMQMDKVGHAMTAFHESRLAVDLLKWSGVPEKKAIWYGSMAGIIFQAPIELFDGYSAAYGASVGDLAANTAGSLMVLGQHLLWKEIRIQMKVSFHQTRFAPMRPNVLGKNLMQQMLKDYNGQTYWLSGNISSFLKKETRFPKWLNIAVGYSAENMVYALREDNIQNGFTPYRQYFLSVDADLQRIKTRSKVLKKVFYVLDMIHLPAPALEINKDGVRLHPIYF
jgi:hypothetical protein